MPGAKGISIAQAGIDVEAVEGRGLLQREAAKLAGISKQSVSEILARKFRWGEYVDKPLFSALRSEQKRAFQVATFELARQSLIRAEESLPKASYLQAVTGYAILRDKERLDAGEPTEIVASVTFEVIADLDKLAARLAQTLINQADTPDATVKHNAKPTEDASITPVE